MITAPPNNGWLLANSSLPDSLDISFMVSWSSRSTFRFAHPTFQTRRRLINIENTGTFYSTLYHVKTKNTAFILVIYKMIVRYKFLGAKKCLDMKS